MQALLDIINSSDVVSLIVLIIILCWIGSWMVRQQPELGQWGWRLAAAAFIGYCLFMGSELEVHAPGAWLRIAWRGILAAGLTAGVSWVVLSVFGFLKLASDRASAAAKARADVHRWERERKRREKEERERQQQWERQAPEREQQQRLAEEQRRQEKAARVEAQQFRDDIRYACELVYSLHETDIAGRFSKQDFRDFLDRYMNDEQPADVLRRRADQLAETIQRHVEAVEPPENLMSLAGLTAWYAKQKASIEGLDIDDSYKRVYLVQLKRRFDELSRRVLEVAKP